MSKEAGQGSHSAPAGRVTLDQRGTYGKDLTLEILRGMYDSAASSADANPKLLAYWRGAIADVEATYEWVKETRLFVERSVMVEKQYRERLEK